MVDQQVERVTHAHVNDAPLLWMQQVACCGVGWLWWCLVPSCGARRWGLAGVGTVAVQSAQGHGDHVGGLSFLEMMGSLFGARQRSS